MSYSLIFSKVASVVGNVRISKESMALQFSLLALLLINTREDQLE